MQADDQVAGLWSAFISTYDHSGTSFNPSVFLSSTLIIISIYSHSAGRRLKWLIRLKFGSWKIFILLLLWHVPAQSQLAFSSNANEEGKHCRGFKLVPVTKNLSLPSSFSHQLQHIQTMEKSINHRRVLPLLTEHVSGSQRRHRQEKC